MSGPIESQYATMNEMFKDLVRWWVPKNEWARRVEATAVGAMVGAFVSAAGEGILHLGTPPEATLAISLLGALVGMVNSAVDLTLTKASFLKR